jgi:hypothetical protein
LEVVPGLEKRRTSIGNDPLFSGTVQTQKLSALQQETGDDGDGPMFFRETKITNGRRKEKRNDIITSSLLSSSAAGV